MKQESRVKKTKEVYRTAVLTLIKQKPITEITVKELSNIVHLNRSTFYLHYQDINALLDSLKTDLLIELELVLERDVSHIKGNDPFIMLKDMFAYLGENKELTMVLLNQHSDTDLKHEIERIIKKFGLPIIKQLYTPLMEEEYDFLFSFITDGSIGIFKKWVETGMQQTPDRIALLSKKIIIQGISALQKP